MLDADVFISYVRGDQLSQHSEKIVAGIGEDRISAYTSSILYDDVISALRSKGMAPADVLRVLVSIASIRHTALPTTAATAISAFSLYVRHGGPRRLHYFDSFHVATASLNSVPIITSDQYILEHQAELGVEAINLTKL